MAHRRLRLRDLPDRGRAQLATRDDRFEVPPAHPPAAERAHRGPRAAPRPAGSDPADAGGDRPPRAGPAPHPLDPPDLARRVVPDPHRGVLQLGPAHGMGPERRARDPDRGWPALLVADRERPPLAAGGAGVSRHRLPRLVVPRPRLHFLEPPVLRVLRARAATVGAVADPRPEPRWDPDERRADARLPARDRLVRDAAARRGARAGRRRPCPTRAAFGYIAEAGGSVAP